VRWHGEKAGCTCVNNVFKFLSHLQLERQLLCTSILIAGLYTGFLYIKLNYRGRMYPWEYFSRTTGELKHMLTDSHGEKLTLNGYINLLRAYRYSTVIFFWRIFINNYYYKKVQLTEFVRVQSFSTELLENSTDFYSSSTLNNRFSPCRWSLRGF
jgi:hypothetical protein